VVISTTDGSTSFTTLTYAFCNDCSPDDVGEAGAGADGPAVAVVAAVAEGLPLSEELELDVQPVASSAVAIIVAAADEARRARTADMINLRDRTDSSVMKLPALPSLNPPGRA
jgi:hypothetical protein